VKLGETWECSVVGWNKVACICVGEVEIVLARINV